MKNLVYIALALLFTLSAEAGGNKFGNNIPQLRLEFYSLQAKVKSELASCKNSENYPVYLAKYSELKEAYYQFMDTTLEASKNMTDGLAIADALTARSEAALELSFDIEVPHNHMMRSAIGNCSAQ